MYEEYLQAPGGLKLVLYALVVAVAFAIIFPAAIGFFGGYVAYLYYTLMAIALAGVVVLATSFRELSIRVAGESLELGFSPFIHTMNLRDIADVEVAPAPRIMFGTPRVGGMVARVYAMPGVSQSVHFTHRKPGATPIRYLVSTRQPAQLAEMLKAKASH